MEKLLKAVPKPRLKTSRIGQILFTVRELIKIARKINSRLLIALFLLSFIGSLIAVPTLIIEKIFIDTLVDNIGNPLWRSVLPFVVMLVTARITLSVIGSFISRVSGYLQRTLAQLFDAYLDSVMAEKLAELDLATIEDSEFKDRFTKIQQESGRRAWGLMMPLANMVDSTVGFISSVAILIFFNPIVAIGAVLVSIPRFFVDSRFIKREYDLAQEIAPLHKKWGWLNYYLIRNRNFMEVKLLNLQGYLVHKLLKVQNEAISAQTKLRRERMVSNFGGTIPLALLELGLTIWLAALVITREITIGSAQLYIRALGSAQANLNTFMNSVLELYENYLYVVDLVWLLNLKPRIETEDVGVLAPESDITVEFDNVWFKYRNGQDWVIRGVSFKINLHEKIALVGLNGSGKSTLIKLLSRFYDPQKGRILINGEELKNININSWRRTLAVLFQEFETYVFSVKESIGYGDVARLEEGEEIVKAAKATDMHDYIMSLPDKYNNPLHNDFKHGERPSAGQSQRLGVSRMLFRKSAQILIMDEPTSNVDPEAEEKIFKELITATKRKILVFVTQRFSTVRLADRILVLEKGKVVEMGTHDQLMKERGRYRELFELQARGYDQK